MSGEFWLAMLRNWVSSYSLKIHLSPLPKFYKVTKGIKRYKPTKIGNTGMGNFCWWQTKHLGPLSWKQESWTKFTNKIWVKVVEGVAKQGSIVGPGPGAVGSSVDVRPVWQICCFRKRRAGKRLGSWTEILGDSRDWWVKDGNWGLVQAEKEGPWKAPWALSRGPQGLCPERLASQAPKPCCGFSQSLIPSGWPGQKQM